MGKDNISKLSDKELSKLASIVGKLNDELYKTKMKITMDPITRNAVVKIKGPETTEEMLDSFALYMLDCAYVELFTQMFDKHPIDEWEEILNDLMKQSKEFIISTVSQNVSESLAKKGEQK